MYFRFFLTEILTQYPKSGDFLQTYRFVSVFWIKTALGISENLNWTVWSVILYRATIRTRKYIEEHLVNKEQYAKRQEHMDLQARTH